MNDLYTCPKCGKRMEPELAGECCSTRLIRHPIGNFLLHENSSLHDVEKEEPFFFKTPHGEKETIDFYRGFIIVRNTVQFTGCKPERKTTVYMFGEWERDENNKCTCCLTSRIDFPKEMRAIKRKIDSIILTGTI